MKRDTARYEKNLREELDGSALYAALTAAKTDSTRKALFLQLSQAEPVTRKSGARNSLPPASMPSDSHGRSARAFSRVLHIGADHAWCCQPSRSQNSQTATSIPASRMHLHFRPRNVVKRR
jgi:hypothetical protein